MKLGITAPDDIIVDRAEVHEQRMRPWTGSGKEMVVTS